MSDVAQLQNFLDMFQSSRGVSVQLAGSLNIETSSIEFSSEYFGDCTKCSEQAGIVLSCRACGRKPGNNIRLLSGSGDGVYSGLVWLGGPEVLAACYLLDDDKKFAEAVGNNLMTEDPNDVRPWLDLFVEACENYLESEVAVAGTLKARFKEPGDLGFIATDPRTEQMGADVSVDHPEANGEYVVLVFLEDMLNSPAAALSIQMGSGAENFNGGYGQAKRPRAVYLIRKDHWQAGNVSKIRTLEVDWQKQSEAWRRSQVVGHVGRTNYAIAMYLNSLNSLDIAELELTPDPEFNEGLAMLYSTRSFGYLVQGALQGDENCRESMVDMIEASEQNDILTPHVVRAAVTPRGWAGGRKELGELVDQITRLWRG